jgi:hypothetical protein
MNNTQLVVAELKLKLVTAKSNLDAWKTHLELDRVPRAQEWVDFWTIRTYELEGEINNLTRKD